MKKTSQQHKNKNKIVENDRHPIKQATLSNRCQTLKEKITLKKKDRQLYVEEQEDVLNSKLHERRALRVGNHCLTHMKDWQLKMPVTLNAAIFQNREEKLRMQKVPLHHSIKTNDQILFKYGKRLLKQDNISRQKELDLIESNYCLDLSRKQVGYELEEYENRCKTFLHKQVMVDDSLDHELSAKLLHQRLQKILDQLNKDIMAAPKRIKQKDKMIAVLEAELNDFGALRERALKYVRLEQKALIPVDKELRNVNLHFFAHISTAKADIEYRRKQGALAKFLAGREANAISYTDVPDILDAQFKRRGRMESMYDIIDRLKKAALVSDIGGVVDCFLDQADVKNQLKMEKEIQKERNMQLKKLLAVSMRSNVFLRFNDTKDSAESGIYTSALSEEAALNRSLQTPENNLRELDALLSLLLVAVHAMAQKLQPVKVEESFNHVKGLVRHDIQVVCRKTQKMVDIIKNNTVPIGPVKPAMLSFFKVQRIPNDAILGGGLQSPHGSISSFQSFQVDHPNSLSREHIKQTSKHILSEHSRKTGKGKK